MIPRHRLRAFRSGPRACPSPIARHAAEENLSHTAAGETRVALGRDWLPMLADLREVGPVLSITRNSHAILGREGPLPELERDREGASAGDAGGEFDFEFDHWGRARAVHAKTAHGHLYSVEWLDAHGAVHHKTCLTSAADPRQFAGWVACHQHSPERPAPPNPSARRGETSAEPGRAIHRGCVDYLLREMISLAQPVRVIVGNEASVQGHVFTPTLLRHSDEWCFVSGGQTGLHLRTRNLAEVLLLETATSAGTFAVLKLYEPEGRLAAVIAPPLDADFSQWNAFIDGRIVFQPPTSSRQSPNHPFHT
ncbi:MAG TPA: ChuX/HutX family heme-like substrate-binding protein [Chthoniobacterales bacterium]